MKIRTITLWLILCHACAAAQPHGTEPVRLIENVTVQALNVYSPDEVGKGWIYRAINALHFRTRESVIRKFLMFKEGDTLKPQLLAGTERNLRTLGCLKSAAVIAQPTSDSTADVIVTTQDSWTTEPGLSFGIRGGKTVYGFQLKEKSLFGTGRALIFDYDKELDRTTRSILYQDPLLLGPYWNGAVSFAWLSDGWQKTAVIERPFYHFTIRWAVRTLFDDLRRTGWIYQNATPISEFQLAHTQFLGQWGIALLATEDLARRITFGFESIDDRFSPTTAQPNDSIPASRRFRFLEIGYEDVENRYLKLNYVNRDERFEDFNLGHHISMQWAISPSAFGTPRSILRLNLAVEKGVQITAQGFQWMRAGFETRWNRKPENEILTAAAGCVVRHQLPFVRTTVTRLQFTQGWNLDADKQFFADEEFGLRAYRPYVFSGSMSLIGNIEERVFLGHELFQLVSPGLAVFCDVGTAGNSGDWRKLKFISDIGAGLRLGLPRAAQHNIIRIDFAYALNRDPLGRKGWLVSIGQSQSF